MNLHDGLRDMIAGGRLTEADIPEDWDWLTAALSGTMNVGDPHTRASVRDSEPHVVTREGPLSVWYDGDRFGTYSVQGRYGRVLATFGTIHAAHAGMRRVADWRTDDPRGD